MAKEEKKGLLGRIGDFVSDKLIDLFGEKHAARIKAGVRLATTAAVINAAMPVISVWTVGIAVGALALGRAAYKKPPFKPVTDLITSTIADLRTLYTGVVKPMVQKVDSTLDPDSPAPEASDNALKGKDVKGPFNGGPASTPSNDVGFAPGASYKVPRNVA